MVDKIHKKDIDWRASSFKDLLNDNIFSDEARSQAGYELNKVQSEDEPSDWKPFDIVGPGTKELRIRTIDGAFRVLYVAKFEEMVYVLHCFKKKSDKTSESDKQIAASRYKELINERKSHGNQNR